MNTKRIARYLHTDAAAKRSVKRHRLGQRQWVVLTWDNRREIWIESHPVDIYKARAMMTEHREMVRSGEIEGKPSR